MEEEEGEAGGNNAMNDLLVWHYWAIPHRETERRGRWRDKLLKAGALRGKERGGKKRKKADRYSLVSVM